MIFLSQFEHALVAERAQRVDVLIHAAKLSRINIFEPIVPRPAQAEGVDALAWRAREFLEIVTRDIQSIDPGGSK